MIRALLLVTVLLLPFAAPQRTVPPGIRTAERMQQPADAVPPAPPVRRAADPAELRRDADQLAVLAQTIPVAVDQATQNRVPKDLRENLKRIEKLAKRLRHDLAL